MWLAALVLDCLYAADLDRLPLAVRTQGGVRISVPAATHVLLAAAAREANRVHGR